MKDCRYLKHVLRRIQRGLSPAMTPIQFDHRLCSFKEEIIREILWSILNPPAKCLDPWPSLAECLDPPLSMPSFSLQDNNHCGCPRLPSISEAHSVGYARGCVLLNRSSMIGADVTLRWTLRNLLLPILDSKSRKELNQTVSPSYLCFSYRSFLFACMSVCLCLTLFVSVNICVA